MQNHNRNLICFLAITMFTAAYVPVDAQNPGADLTTRIQNLQGAGRGESSSALLERLNRMNPNYRPRQAETQESPTTPREPSAQELLETGNLFLENGHYETARDYFLKALALDRESVAVQSRLAVCYYHLGKLKEAEPFLRYWVDQAPKDSVAYSNYAVLLTELKRYKEAEQMAHKATSLAPKNPDTHNNLGYTYLMQKAYSKAIPSFKKALTLSPQKGLYHYNLARSYFGSRDRVQTIASLKRYWSAKERNPGTINPQHFPGLMKHPTIVAMVTPKPVRQNSTRYYYLPCVYCSGSRSERVWVQGYTTYDPGHWSYITCRSCGGRGFN